MGSERQNHTTSITMLNMWTRITIRSWLSAVCGLFEKYWWITNRQPVTASAFKSRTGSSLLLFVFVSTACWFPVLRARLFEQRGRALNPREFPTLCLLFKLRRHDTNRKQNELDRNCCRKIERKTFTLLPAERDSYLRVLVFYETSAVCLCLLQTGPEAV